MISLCQAVGTRSGAVLLLDLEGNLLNSVSRRQLHKAAVSCISFDGPGDWMASGSEDGSVVVVSVAAIRSGIAGESLSKLVGVSGILASYSGLAPASFFLIRPWQRSQLHTPMN